MMKESDPTPVPTSSPIAMPSSVPSSPPSSGPEVIDASGNEYVFLEAPVDQSDGQTYSIELNYTCNGVTVDYPELRCGHTTPIPVSVVETGLLEWTEVLDYNDLDRCDTNGKVTLTQIGSKWQYNYTFSSVSAVVNLSVVELLPCES